MSKMWAIVSVITIIIEIAIASTNQTVNGTLDEDGGVKCHDGLILSKWMPQGHLSSGQKFTRGLVYFLAMCYLFLGVSIVSDQFMAAIEMITSKEKEVKVKQANGETQIVVVRVWNATVANLSLMALGTSAPEIFLASIEMFAKNFEAGELGPGTIVGSAAYNLFVITAICVVIIPDGDVRRIKHLRVFFVTTTWSLFAYVWLYMILATISPGRVEVWEGLLTFLFFPITILTAYIADKKLYRYFVKSYRINKRGMVIATEGVASDVELALNSHSEKRLESGINGGWLSEEDRNFEESRREFLSIFDELRKKYSQRSIEEIEKMCLEKLLQRAPKSRAFYEMQGHRSFTRRPQISRRIQQHAMNEIHMVKWESKQLLDPASQSDEDLQIPRILFNPGHYTVMENCGQVKLTVIRDGDLWQSVSVDYETEDGSAVAEEDYVPVKGTLVFQPGVHQHSIVIDIIDDSVFELDEVFYVHLKISGSNAVKLGVPHVATVLILDDDHAGYFTLDKKDHVLTESVGSYELIVKRLCGATGSILVPYWTEDGTAKAGKDYGEQHGNLEFETNETVKIISLGIIEEGSYEKDVLFYVNLGEPQMVEDDELATLIQAAEAKAPEDLTEEEKMALLGRPKAGDIVRAQLRIKESKEFKNTVDKLVQRANASLLIGTSSWKEQFTEALTVSPGGDDNEDYEEGEEPKPSCGDYIMHFLTLFWKLIFAFIPPTDITGGYLCFFVSIFCIGVVTAIIGDVASHFGCTLGIKDSVTAVVFVALGTSVPDTFASKVAAIQDKYADASVGNVTGSNAVNVFLGIGVAWTIAAIYHELNGTVFEVEPGNLAFSVTLFCSEALIAIFVLLLRRSKAIGGELGGPKGIKYLSGAVLLGLWFIYLIMSTLEAYDVIPGF